MSGERLVRKRRRISRRSTRRWRTVLLAVGLCGLVAGVAMHLAGLWQENARLGTIGIVYIGAAIVVLLGRWVLIAKDHIRRQRRLKRPAT